LETLSKGRAPSEEQIHGELENSVDLLIHAPAILHVIVFDVY